MKVKILSIAGLLLVSSNVFAWQLAETSVSDRTFEVRVNKDYSITVENVTCTKSDGYDSMYVSHYNSIVGNGRVIETPIEKSFQGTGVKNANRIDKSILPAYMKFCAIVNKSN